jgi:hypothetical protein
VATELSVDPFELGNLATAVKSAAQKLDRIDLGEPLPVSAFAQGKALAQALESAKQGMGLWQHGVKGTQMLNTYVIQAAAREFPSLDHATAQQVDGVLKKAADSVPTVPGTGDTNPAPAGPAPAHPAPGDPVPV